MLMPGGFDSVEHYKKMGFQQCPKCAAWETDDSAKFCMHCGVRLDGSVPEPDVEDPAMIPFREPLGPATSVEELAQRFKQRSEPDVAALIEQLVTHLSHPARDLASGELTISQRYPSWPWSLNHSWLGTAEGSTLAEALRALGATEVTHEATQRPALVQRPKRSRLYWVFNPYGSSANKKDVLKYLRKKAQERWPLSTATEE